MFASSCLLQESSRKRTKHPALTCVYLLPHFASWGFSSYWSSLRVVCSVPRQCHENAGVPALTASAPTRHRQCSETPGNRWLVVVPAANASTAAGVWCTQNLVRGWLLGFVSTCSRIWRYLQVSPPPPGAFELGLRAAV